MSCVVVAGLSKRDPKHAANYHENAEAYRAKLRQLDEYILRVIALIPEEKRLLVTGDDAFGYFGRRYELPIHVVNGDKLSIDGLYTHWMGKPGTYEGTYIGMMDYNATVIARSLGGQAPKRGMNGRLTQP